jgi:hypothetical protein
MEALLDFISGGDGASARQRAVIAHEWTQLAF